MEPSTLCESVRLHAARMPRQTALYCGDAAISWYELDDSTTALARWLHAQGLQPGDRVAVYAPNSIELVQVFLASQKAGLIAATVNTRLKPAEIRVILEHAQPKLVFCDPALRSTLDEARVVCPVIERLPPLAAGAEALPDYGPAQPGVIIYTSGTTGKPKGVLHTQGSLFQKGVKSAGLSAGAPGAVRVISLPMMHVSGQWLLSMNLYMGSPTALLPKFEPGAALDTIERFAATDLGGLPTMIQALIEEQAVRPRDVSSLRWVISGGDVVSPTLQERFAAVFGLELLELYGMTEMCAICINPSGGVRPGSAGPALRGIEVRAVDDEGRPLPVGEVGEIAVRGSSLFTGYWDDPEATGATVRNGWFHTGDLGLVDADGYVWFRGRKKEIIIRAGSNISPQEVEEALYKHPAVLEAGVIGLPCPTNGERVAAFVVLRDGQVVDADALRQFARHHIADYKAPEEVHFLSVLPKNSVGKVQRRALRDSVVAG